MDLTLVGMSRDQGKTFPLDERVRIDVDGKAAGGWLTLSREMRLPAGVAQVRALARDVASGLAGTVTQRLEVPALDGPVPGHAHRTGPDDRGRAAGPRASCRSPTAASGPKGHLYCSYEVVGHDERHGRSHDPRGRRVHRCAPATGRSSARPPRPLSRWPSRERSSGSSRFPSSGSKPGSTNWSSTWWMRPRAALFARASSSCWRGAPASRGALGMGASYPSVWVG